MSFFKKITFHAIFQWSLSLNRISPQLGWLTSQLLASAWLPMQPCHQHRCHRHVPPHPTFMWVLGILIDWRPVPHLFCKLDSTD